MNSSGGQPAAQEESDFWFPAFMVACAALVMFVWICFEPREETKAPEPVHAAARP